MRINLERWWAQHKRALAYPTVCFNDCTGPVVHIETRRP